MPIRPTRPFLVSWAAAWAALSTTPKMGMPFSAWSTSRAVVDTVPQAMTMAFGSKVRRKAASCRAYFTKVSFDRLP